MTSKRYDFHRLLITGTLTTDSLLHIGTGEIEERENDDGSLNTLLADPCGKPYIPASTLRGYLRDILAQTAQTERLQRLFGTARTARSDNTLKDETDKDADVENDGKSVASKHQGNMGLLSVYDAILADNIDPKTCLTTLSRTAIDPVTQTAQQHKLMNYQAVQPGTVFSVELTLDKVSREEAGCLLGLLETLDAIKNNGFARLGKSKSSGQGQMTWNMTAIQGQTRQAYIDWLSVEAAQPVYTLPQPEIVVITPELTLWQAHVITLNALSPMLINDPQLAEQRQATEKHGPDRVFMRRDKRAIIPGSTLKGWLRGQCRKILLTIADDPHTNKTQAAAETLLAQLFGGSETGTGFLCFSDATVPIEAKRIHQQTFNAVDCFTGGVKDTALYKAEAIFPDQPFTGRIYWRGNKRDSEGLSVLMSEGLKLLLLFALRDAMEGDLVLGWGKSKGYGRLVLQTQESEKWSIFQQRLFSTETAITAAFEQLKTDLNNRSPL